jgi:hypothetical protein
MKCESNILSRQLYELVNKIESRHFNDPSVTIWLNKMLELLLENEKKTIDFFHQCNASHLHIVYWISPQLEDIIGNFPSKEMLNSIMALASLYAEDKSIQSGIQSAINLATIIRKIDREEKA